MAEEITLNAPLEAVKPKRNATMDLLRIFAMFFIVVHHLTINNIGLSVIETGVDMNFLGQYLGTSFVDCFVIIGVNIFFMLSGFFGINFKPRKIFSLVFKVYVYWIIAGAIAMAIGIVPADNAWGVVKFFVIGISKYWFVLMYLLLMIFAPALNVIAVEIVKRKGGVGYFVFLTTLFFLVVGFVADYFYPILGTNRGYSVIWAAVPYLYGRIVALKGDKLKKSPAFWAVAYLVFTLANYAVIAPLIATGHGKVAWHFYSYNNPLVLASSICFFLAFWSAKPITDEKAAKVISFIGVHTLAVYLWHSNNPLFSPYRAFLMNLVESVGWKFALLLPNAVIVFAVGIAIDSVYELLLAKPLGFVCEKLEIIVMKLYNGGVALLEKIFGAKKTACENENNSTEDVENEDEGKA